MTDMASPMQVICSDSKHLLHKTNFLDALKAYTFRKNEIVSIEIDTKEDFIHMTRITISCFAKKHLQRGSDPVQRGIWARAMRT